jgi:hypothetical protein
MGFLRGVLVDYGDLWGTLYDIMTLYTSFILWRESHIKGNYEKISFNAGRASASS